MRAPIFARFQFMRGPAAGIVVGLAMAAVGIFLSFFASGASAQDAGLLDTAYAADRASLDAAAVDSDVVVEGILQDNTELDGNGFVAYITHRLVQRSNATTNGKQTNQWQFFESNFGQLSMQIEGGSVLLTPQGSISVLSGTPIEIIDTTEEFAGRPATFAYNGQMLATGAKRIRGLRNGDLITVIGRRTASGGIVLRRIHAGDRESFQAVLKKESTAGHIFGYAALGLGVLVLVLSLRSILSKPSAQTLRRQPA